MAENKVDIDNEEHDIKIAKYLEREIRWTDKALNQLSFFNNFLLTLSIGFLSFSYKILPAKHLKLTFSNIECSTSLLIVSFIFIGLSIFFGLFVALNRLLDFRFTRHVVQVRRRTFKKSKEKLDEVSPNKFFWLRRVFLPIEILICPIKITMEDCKKYKDMIPNDKKEFKKKFRNLRNRAHNFSLNTWRNTICQILLFSISIFFYLFAVLFKNYF